MEVSDPSMSVLAEGLGGPKSYILNKKVNTLAPYLGEIRGLEGSRINIFSKFAFLHCRWFNTRVRAASRIGPEVEDKDICLDGNFVTGFADAESSFIILISQDKNYKLGWTVKPRFAINLHSIDLPLLELIKSYFGNVGNISKSKHSAQFRVASLKDLTNIIIPHFDKYPLLTQKKADFLLFKKAINIINGKEHLTKEGLEKLVALKGSLNLGLTTELIEAFPNITLVERPVVSNAFIQSPQWLSGFTNGEGSFMIKVKKSATCRSGFQVHLEFEIAQNIRDITLMESLINFLDCGAVYRHSKIVHFRVSKFSDIDHKIIALFKRYPIKGVKAKDFANFCKVAKLINSNAHLTDKGLKEIFNIKRVSGAVLAAETAPGGQEIITKEDNYDIVAETKNTFATSPVGKDCSTITSFNLRKATFKGKFPYSTFKSSFHTRVKADKRIGPHNLCIFSVITGSLLGNAIITRSVEGTRICYRQSSIHKDYLFWLYNFFYTQGYCTNLEPRMYTRLLKHRGKEVQHFGYEFNTFTFRSFNWLHEMFYHKGKKVINPMIEEFITPLSLAIWISDDGGWAKPGVRIATNSFSFVENELLVNILKRKFNLDCTIQTLKASGNYSIYIKSSSIPTLREIVLSHMHSSMKYKLGL